MGGMERTSEVGFNNCGFANGCTTLDASSILWIKNLVNGTSLFVNNSANSIHIAMGYMDQKSEMVFNYCGITNNLAAKDSIFTFESLHGLLCGSRFRSVYISDSTPRNRDCVDMGRLDKPCEMVFNNRRCSD